MSGSALSKTCRDCSRDLPLSAYQPHAQCLLGVRPECRDCTKAHKSLYYQNNRDRFRPYKREYYLRNADGLKASFKIYNQANANKIKEQRKQYRADNHLKVLERKRAFYKANKDKILPASRAYHKAHPEYSRLSCYARKARLKAASGKCTAAQFLAKCEYHGWRCYLCQTLLTLKTVQMDHRKPLARGGSNWPANFAPACGPCNLSKGRKTESEFKTN